MHGGRQGSNISVDIFVVLLYEYDISERHSSVNGAAAFLASTLLLKPPL